MLGQRQHQINIGSLSRVISDGSVSLTALTQIMGIIMIGQNGHLDE